MGKDICSRAQSPIAHRFLGMFVSGVGMAIAFTTSMYEYAAIVKTCELITDEAMIPDTCLFQVYDTLISLMPQMTVIAAISGAFMYLAADFLIESKKMRETDIETNHAI